VKRTITLVALFYAALPALAGTVTNAQISGLGGTTVFASANAYYSPFATASDPSLISASADVTAVTLGLVRSGFIEVSGWIPNLFEPPGGANGQINGDFIANLLPSPQPFTLGVPFQIDVSAFAGWLGANGPTEVGSGQITFQFSLYENVGGLPGFQPIIVYDASAVPEPWTFALVGVFLSMTACVCRKRGTEGD
jgi:hypothetical protein